MKETKERYAHKRWPLLAIVVFVGFSIALKPDASYKGNRITTIMLDAGHGGTDPGNLGTGRYKETEKDVTLRVTQMVGKYIEENVPDVKVYYTRTGDTYPELHERTKMANRMEVDLFVSIHCDAFTKEAAYGCGSYVMGTAKTEANLRMAQKENAAMLKEDDYEKNYAGFDPYSPESYIELSLRQNAFQTQSLSFSEKVQRQFRERVGRKDRGVKQAPYWVISFTTMPSVLVELGFLTNKKEEDFLRSEQGQEYMASAIYRAFKEYKAEIEGKEYNEIAEPLVNEETMLEAEEVVIENEEGILFTVQLASASAPVELIPDNFKGLQGVREHKSGSLYKYTYGRAKKYKKAKELLKNVESSGYNGCFIIALKDGERMDLGEAIRTVGK
ncbi:MAG: N-acetylmuramoyl-L-alanine amidase [Flavobacteriales bacterium]|nr:N-acetylmuramoyl-L-alanine amidase [Flavobacteriales bacterium]